MRYNDMSCVHKEMDQKEGENAETNEITATTKGEKTTTKKNE